MIAGDDWELIARAHASSGAVKRASFYPGILAVKSHRHYCAGHAKEPVLGALKGLAVMGRFVFFRWGVAFGTIHTTKNKPLLNPFNHLNRR